MCSPRKTRRDANSPRDINPGMAPLKRFGGNHQNGKKTPEGVPPVKKPVGEQTRPFPKKMALENHRVKPREKVKPGPYKTGQK